MPVPNPADGVVLVDAVRNGLPFRQACAQRDLPVIGLYTIAPAVLRSMAPDHADGDVLSLYGQDAEEIVGTLSRTGARPAGVVPATEPGVRAAADVAARLDLPGNPVETAAACRDKRLMRRRAGGRNVRVPRWACSRRRDLRDTIRRVGTPVIVKPAGGAGSHNVFLVRGEGDLPRVAEATSRDLFGGAIDEWLVEEYVRGREFAVNTMTVDGDHRVLDVWEYRLPDGRDYDNPYWDFVQTEGADAATASRFALEVLDAFEIGRGPCHIELKLPRGDEGSPVLIEIGARLPGAGIPSMWERHSALRPYADTLAVHLGERPSLADGTPPFEARLGMCFLRHDGPPGILRGWHGLDEVRAMPEVDEVVVHHDPGDRVATTTSLGDELAVVRLHARDDAALASSIARVRSTLLADVDPGTAERAA